MSGHGPDTGMLVLLGCLAAGYELMSLRVRWSRWRGAAFMTGCVLAVAAVAVPAHDFTGHMTRHLLLGMLAPLGLVLGAPVTLLLRALSVPYARVLSRVMRSGPVRALTHPVTALVLSVGTLVLLYLTPLYAVLTGDPALHRLVDLHFLLSGALFAWAVAGPDPAPHRPAVAVRLVVLGVAVAAHATLSQLLYAGALVSVVAAAADRRTGATIMYYGGDVAELLIAFALVASWHPRRRGAPARFPADRAGPVPG